MPDVRSALAQIRSGPPGPAVGAFFDFDGTIIEGYSALAFYTHRLRNFEVGPEEATRTMLAAFYDAWQLVKAHPAPGPHRRLGGPPLWATGKARAARRFAADHDVDLTTSSAYANGDEDIAFLSVVGRPHAVNPGGRLARAAAKRQWPVLRFDSGKRRLDPLPVMRTTAMWSGLFASIGTGIGVGLFNRNKREVRALFVDTLEEWPEPAPL